MADHLFIAGTIISICFGAGLYTYIKELERRYEDEVLKWLTHYVIYFNLVMIFLLSVEYFRTNINSSAINKELITSLFGDACLVFWPLIYTSIAGAVLVLIKSKFSKRISIVNWIILLVFGIVILGKNIFYSKEATAWFNAIYDGTGIFIDLLEVVTLSYLFIVSFKIEDKSRRIYQISFASLFLLRYVFDIFLFYIPIHLVNIRHEFYVAFAAGSTLFVFNFIPLVWLKYYFKTYHEKNKTNEAIVISVEIADKYNISPREREIISLILEGKSNRDIKEQLFLSDHTVKNHIYKIFKKLGISSRFELISLFASR